MRLIDWLRGRRLDDELDGEVLELFTRASPPARLDTTHLVRAQAHVSAQLDRQTGQTLARPGLAMLGAGTMLNSIWNATNSHRVAAAVAAGAILLGSGMAAEASGLGPAVREAVQDAVQGDQQQTEQLVEELNENANSGAIVETIEDERGNLVTHIGGSGHLLSRAVLNAFDGTTLMLDGAGDDVDEIVLAPDAVIIIPGPPSDENPRDRLAALAEDAPLVIVQGTCTSGDNGVECIATSIVVLGRPDTGKPEDVGGGSPQGAGSQAESAGKPEGVGGGKPENPGKPEDAGKPDNSDD